MSDKRPKVIKAWADIGSHGKIFMFCGGPVADRYPTLLHIYAEQVTHDLVPVEIRVKRQRTAKVEKP